MEERQRAWEARPPAEETGTPSATDTERYPGSSEGYQDDRIGYSEPPGEARDSEDYGDGSDAYEEYFDPPASPRVDEPVGGWMPDEALGAAVTGVEGLKPERREWQVNVRLDRVRYSKLVRAADLYGTRPTSMARMLINRGAEAVVNAHLAEMQAFGRLDPEG